MEFLQWLAGYFVRAYDRVVWTLRPWVKSHNVVLWGSVNGYQFGTHEDLQKAEFNRRLAVSYRKFAEVMRRNQVALSNLGITAKEATKRLQRLGVIARPDKEAS